MHSFTEDLAVVIPNFNRVEPLRTALQSIVMQTVLPRQVLVVDDCSHRDALEQIRLVIAEFRTALDIQLIENSENRGANYCRNVGLRACQCRFVAFLDSDDLWLPDKIEVQMGAVRNARNMDGRPILSATGRYRVNERGNVIALQFGGKSLRRRKLLASNFIGTLSSIIVETWVARFIGGFDETLSACQDWDFFIRLSEYVQYVGVSEPLCVYVDHQSIRISNNGRKRLISHMLMFRKYISGDTAVNRGELYRNIAEDLQALGKYTFARRFLLRALREQLLHKEFGRFSELLAMGWIGPLFGLDIKDARYRKYKTSVALARKKENQRMQRDQQTIYCLICSP